MKKSYFVVILVLILICGYQFLNRKFNPYEDSTLEQRKQFARLILPIQINVPFKISQGAFGCCTHNLPGYQYALDFDVPYGTPVVAVNDGKVIQVYEPNKGGGCDQKFNGVAHNIKIEDLQGLVAQYVHVQSKVRIGDLVKKGDIIAVTANNDFHCVPQLHFNVFKDAAHTPEQSNPETVPVLFDGIAEDGIAREGYVRH